MSESSDGKRRLPVLQPEEAEESRSPKQWVVIGTVGIGLFFVPLAMLANSFIHWVTRAHMPDSAGGTVAAYQALDPAVRLKISLVMLLAPVLALALAALFGGALVGRFGGRAQIKEATLAGLAAGGGVVVYSVLRNGVRMLTSAPSLPGVLQLLMSSVIVLLVATMLARLGGWLGFRRRPSISGS